MRDFLKVLGNFYRKEYTILWIFLLTICQSVVTLAKEGFILIKAYYCKKELKKERLLRDFFE